MRIVSGSGALERPTYAWVGVALLVFTAIFAIPVGVAMVAAPDGDPVGIPHSWIAGTPFGSYLIPGIFLLAMNGAGQLVTAALVALRHPLSPWLTGFFGVGLMIWIVVQTFVIPFSALQPILFAVGTIEGFVALFWLRRLGYFRFG